MKQKHTPPEAITGDTGEAIAYGHRPTFHQGFKGQHDLITPIALVPTAADMPFTAKPTVYYSVKRDDYATYLLYCVFHFRDWTSSEWNIVQTLDSHKYDFEGALIIRRCDQPDIVKGISTVFHNDILFHRGDSWLWIEPEGHGIIPTKHKKFKDTNDNRIIYRDYRLEDINGFSFQSQLSRLRGVFNPNGVHLPDQWNHWLIRNKFGKGTDGLIWSNPRELWRLAKKAQIVDHEI